MYNFSLRTKPLPNPILIFVFIKKNQLWLKVVNKFGIVIILMRWCDIISISDSAMIVTIWALSVQKLKLIVWYGYNQTQSSLNNKLFVIRIRRKYWSYIFKSDSDIYVYSDNIRDLEAFLNMEVTFICKPWYSKVSLASKGSRIAERGKEARVASLGTYQ